MRTRRFRSRGAGYATSQQFFNPDVLPPHTEQVGVSTAPTDYAIRPVLQSTFKGGKRARRSRSSSRRSRKVHGGFSPSVMGSFIKNAQSAIVPLALYSAYHFMPKKSRNIFSVRRKTRRSRK